MTPNYAKWHQLKRDGLPADQVEAFLRSLKIKVGDTPEEIADYWGDSTDAERDLCGAILLEAWYTHEDYEGEAYVFYWKAGKFYSVYGAHCSCEGLEGQWEPEETTPEDEDRFGKLSSRVLANFIPETA